MLTVDLGKYIKNNMPSSGKGFIKKLETINFQPIALRLMNPEQGLGWEHEQVEQAITSYTMFLFLLYLYPDQRLVPSKNVDQVWHYHIIDTQKYAEDCNILFGHFVHHLPYFDLIDESREEIEKAFLETQALIERYFLTEPDSKDHSACGRPD